METLIKYTDQNIIDFILTYKGGIEYLIPFLVENNINYDDFNLLSDKIYSEYNTNINTNFYNSKNMYVTTKLDSFTSELGDFSSGFSDGFSN